MRKYVSGRAFAMVFAGLLVRPVSALPTLVDFNNDIPGSRPSIGGLGQPTSLVEMPGTHIVVASSANGLSTQPVVLRDDGILDYVSVDIAIAPVGTGHVRIEAKVSFDSFINGYFLQTGLTTESAVISRLEVTSNGTILGSFQGPIQQLIGNYLPNIPFGVRMDVDMTGKSWSATIDSNQNGFDDDPIVQNLVFANNPAILTSLGGVGASFNRFGDAVGPASVAYDDISIYIPVAVPEPSALLLMFVGLVTFLPMLRSMTSRVGARDAAKPLEV